MATNKESEREKEIFDKISEIEQELEKTSDDVTEQTATEEEDELISEILNEIREEEQNANLSDENDQLAKDFAELNDKMLRTAAEFDNYRKRTDKEKKSSISFGMGVAIEKMLPAIDALEMACGAETTDETYKKGVEMTLSLFKTAFSGLGITEIEAVGKEFDPNLHAAVSNIETEEYESGIVANVLQKGYKLDEKVIRHAMVVVAK